MLEINALIGAGNTRECYRHPEDEKKCIKIMKTKADFNVNRLEYCYYKSLYKQGKNLTHIPNCYAFVKTNIGVGLVFDLITTEDSTPEETLYHKIKNGNLSKTEAKRLIDNLGTYLLKESIAFSDASLDNLLVKNNIIYIVDGLIPNRFIKTFLYCYIGFVRQWRVKKSIKRLIKKIDCL